MKTINHETKTVTMTKAEYKKVHRDYKGTRNGEPEMMVLNPTLGTCTYNVEIREKQNESV